MGSDRGDSFPFDFEPNGDPFGSKSKRKLSPRWWPTDGEANNKLCRIQLRIAMDIFTNIVVD